MLAIRLAGACSPLRVGTGFRPCLIRPCATSVSSRLMHLRVGKAAGFRLRRNGNTLRARRPSKETRSTRENSILLQLEVQGLSNFSAIAGNGRRAPIPVIRDTRLFRARSANITASSCPAKWLCAGDGASLLRVTFGRPVGISFHCYQMGVLGDSLDTLKGFVEMATYVQTVDIGHSATADEREALTREVRRGLTARPRSLSPWMFYDAEGSRLFERITTLPEYYPTRTERAILAGHADAIIAAAHWDRSLPLRLVELGAGTASKTRILLEAAMRVSA